MKLEISSELSLPIDAVTQKIAVLGMTGSGKSYCMTKLAEEMLDARAQVVILDPKGEAWGLRLLADGKSKGYPIPVFGGEHGDLPLRPDMGARIVDLIVDGDYSAVLDVSEFISSELARFGYDFATRLFERKKQRPGAMCLMIDECQDFIPQNPAPATRGESNYEPKMLHAFERVGKQLRSKGVGMVLAGQRPQEINKKVLNMCEIWFAFQMTGLQERETMEKIIKDADREEASKLKEILPTLETGHAHVWSPRLLKVSAEYKILEKKTFDSSATPEVGARRVEPRKLSPVDVEQLTVSMQDIIEQAKSEDPKELRKRITELERQLKSNKPIVDQSSIDRAVSVAVQNVEKQYQTIIKEQERSVFDLSGRLKRIEDIAHLNGDAPKPIELPKRETPVKRAVPPTVSRTIRAYAESGTLGGGERKILSVLAQYTEGRTKKQVAILAGYSIKGGAFNNYLGALRSKGYIDRSEPIHITDDGLLALGEYEPLPSGQALIDHWRGQLGKAERAILDAVIEAYPNSLTKEEVASRANYEASGGGFNNALGKLRTLELINGRGELKATDEFFI